MAALIPNIVKGKFAHYAGLPAANDALVWILMTGSETDDNVRDADTVTALIATALNEATFAGYARVTATGVTVTVDDTNNRVDVDAADPSWNPTSAEAITREVLCYEPDTTAPSDANKIPIFVDDVGGTTPTSGSFGYTVASGGFARAS